MPGPESQTQRTTSVVVLFVTSGLAVGVPGRASAGDVEPVQFAYSAPSTCPDAEAFVKEVRARTARFRIIEGGPGLRSFEVRIAAAPNGFTGMLRVVDRTGAVSARSVERPQCDDVAKTLALVTAISIDPEAASGSDAPASATSTSATPSADPASATLAAAPLATTPPSSPSSPSPANANPPLPRATIATAAPQEAVAQQAASPAPPPRSWQATVGVGAFAQGLAAPGAVVGEAAFAGLALEGPSVWSPELRIGAAQASSGSIAASPGSLNLAWIVARVDACPLRWPARGPLAVRPCLTADVGALSASVIHVPTPQSPVRPWGTLGALALGEWEPAGPLFLAAELSLSTPLQRDQFYVGPQPAPTVYQAPLFVPAGALEMGVRFP
jgi:hypothetical protein